MSKKTLFSLLSFATLLIFACTLPSSKPEANDPNIIFTAAAETASSQLTQIAMDSLQTETPPSQPPTLAPSFTPNAPTAISTESNCDKAAFVKDVTVPDGTIFTPNEPFTKTWRVKNIGTCTWTTGYALVFDGGAQLVGASPQPLTANVAPGETIDISVNLSAPATDGSYTGNWQIKNATGVLFAKIYVQIKVGDAVFAVTSVQDLDAYYISGRGAALTAKITANKAGEVEYHWIIRESGQADIAIAIEKITFSSAGTEEVSYLWSACPHAGSFTAYLYIDDPNHQEFGQADFNCP